MKKRNKKRQKKSQKWEPFQEAYVPEETWNKHAELLRKTTEMTEKEIQKFIRRERAGKVYKNNLYQVVIFEATVGEEFPEMLHLSIKRLDRHPVRDWRHFQRIKNEILGEEYEAVELYPKESRLVDAANQFHLWALKNPELIFPFGFFERLVDDGSGSDEWNSKQRIIE